MKYSSRIYSTMCAWMIASSTLQATDNPNPWVVVGIIGLASAVGAAAGALGMRSSYESEAHKARELEAEKKIVAEAEVTLQDIERRQHQFLRIAAGPTYNNIAHLHPANELSDLTYQVDDFAEKIEQHKQQLKIVLGNQPGSSEHYAKAEVFYRLLTQHEQRMKRTKALLKDLMQHRDRPLKAVNKIGNFVQNIQVPGNTLSQLMVVINRYYATAITRDGIKGLPIVCAVEDINNKIIEIEKLRSLLEHHMLSLVGHDPAAESGLKQLIQWHSILTNIVAALASTTDYRIQAAANQAAYNTRLDVESKHMHQQERLVRAYEELQRAKEASLKETNEQARLALANKQAATNLVQSVANSVQSAADLVREQEKAREHEREEREKRCQERVLSAWCQTHQQYNHACESALCRM